MEAVVFVLAGVLVLQDILHRIERQTLVNKLMSRNYTEYVQNQALKKPQSQSKSIEEPELPEDLRALQEFRM